jgi:hypothetical protein
MAREAARRRRRLIMLGTLAGFVAVAAAAAWLLRDPPPPQRPQPGDVRAGSEEIDNRGALRIRRPTSSYRIVYRVDDYAGGDHTVTTDDIRVDRPFDSRIERKRGEPPGGEVTFTQVVTFARLSVPRSGATREAAIVNTPNLASGDMRFDTGLPAAIEAGLVKPREWRRIEGRRCRVYRTGGPVGTGDVTPYDPKGPEYADVCIDAEGFMLEELWVADGRAMRRKLATSIKADIQIPDRLLKHTGTPIPTDKGGGSVRPAEPASYPPGMSWFVRSVPDGFEQRGRYAVVPSQPELVEEENRDRRRASIVDVFTRGVDLLIVDQGGTQGGVTIFEPDPTAKRVEVVNFGDAEGIAGFRLNEVRILLDRGKWIRVQGTLPLDDLVDVANSLEAIESETDELVYLDEGPAT